MVFPIVLAVIAGASQEGTLLIDKNLLVGATVELTKAVVAGEEGEDAKLDTATFTALSSTNRQIVCPKNYYSGIAYGVEKTNYEDAVTSGGQYKVEAKVPTGTWDLTRVAVDCYKTCDDHPSSLPWDAAQYNCEVGTNATDPPTGSTTYGQWACTVLTAKDPALPDKLYNCGSGANGLIVSQSCPKSSGTCTQVEIGDAPARGTECTVANQATHCVGKGKKTVCVNHTCAECTVENQAAKCTADGKTKCVEGNCAAGSAAAMSYGAAALLVALMF